MEGYKCGRRGFFSILFGGSMLLGARLNLLAQGVGLKEKDFRAFDDEIQQFMSERLIPGGAVAVFNRGECLYAKGYGYAELESQRAATADTVFRIASLSKPITAVAVLKLVEDKTINLDEPVINFLKDVIKDYGVKLKDKRWEKITVNHLLHHTGGFDSNRSGDPMFLPEEKIAEAIGSKPPLSPMDVVIYMLGQELDFEPGDRYAYSNFGYCLLGRVIEKITRESYADYTRKKVLEPAGIRGICLAHTGLDEKQPGEAVYYTAFNHPKMRELPASKREDANPYGSFKIELMDAHGGWLSSVLEYAKFCMGIKEFAPARIIKPETFQLIIQRPPRVWRKEDGSEEPIFYGCGFMVRPLGEGGKVNLWHSGSLPGTYSFAAILGNDRGWVVMFNARSADEKNLPNSAIDPALHHASARSVW